MDKHVNKATVHFDTEDTPFADESALLYKTKAHVQLGQRERTVGLVIKRLANNKKARAAVGACEKLRAMGVTLLPATYKMLAPEGAEVIMTDFEKGGKVAISSNQLSKIKLGTQTSIDIPSFKVGLAKIESAILTVARNRVQIPDISYFVILPATGGENVRPEFVIGDMDHFDFDSPASPGDIAYTNAYQVYEFLRICLFSDDPDNRVVADAGNRAELKDIAEKWRHSIYEKSKDF